MMMMIIIIIIIIIIIKQTVEIRASALLIAERICSSSHAVNQL